MDTTILERVGHAYGVKGANLTLLGGFDKNVFLSPDKNIVIKLLDTEKYTEASLLREIEIMTFMENHGIKTASLQENLLMSGEEMYVIDFGDVRKSWYIYDVAIPIYTALEHWRHAKSKNGSESIQWFTQTFLAGYCQETHLSDEARNWLPFFIEYRLLYSYLYFIRAFKEQEISAHVERILENMRIRIETGKMI